MAEEKTRNIVGNIPEPDELYGREELIEHLWRQIQGNNIFLLAPRRFGKSGVMRHVLQKPRQGYLPISLDLEDVDSPGEFVWRVTNELLSRNKLRSALQSARQLPGVLGDWVKGTFDEAGFEGAKVKFKDAVEPNWKQTAKRLLLEMEKSMKRLSLSSMNCRTCWKSSGTKLRVSFLLGSVRSVYSKETFYAVTALLLQEALELI